MGSPSLWVCPRASVSRGLHLQIPTLSITRCVMIFSLLQKRRARIGDTPSMAETVPTRASHTTVPFPMSPEAPWAYPIIHHPPPLLCPPLHLVPLHGLPDVPSGQKSKLLLLLSARITRSHSGASYCSSLSLLPFCSLFTTPYKLKKATLSGWIPEDIGFRAAINGSFG